MTAKFPKGPLWARPEAIANVIVDGLRRRRNVIYAPWYWGTIMCVIRWIPEEVFKRMKL
jgi:decaprenylphospho-beta-D-erythro-pentofuranosid-2-ulose 2-reductase